MKIRTGFVSNSSSSSFIAVLVSRQENWDAIRKWICENYLKEDEQLYEYEELEEYDYGRFRHSSWPQDLLLFESDPGSLTLGLDLDGHIQEGRTIDECKIRLSNMVREITGIKVPVKDISFEYGEWSNGG